MNNPLLPGKAERGRDAEKGSAVDERVVIRKVNQHILLKFFLMTILCYIGMSPSA